MIADGAIADGAEVCFRDARFNCGGMLHVRERFAAANPGIVRLNPFNQSWAQHAALLVVVVSKETFTPPGASQEVASHSHSFDAGAAWANLALQALRLGWHSHAMVGFDFEATRTALHVPEGFRIEAAIAIGRQTDKSVLPEALLVVRSKRALQPVWEIGP